MTRDELKKEYHDYRAAAKRACEDLPNVTVSDHATVTVTADRDGAFVEAVIWVPKEKITSECLGCGKETTGFDEKGPLCIDCALIKALKEGS